MEVTSQTVYALIAVVMGVTIHEFSHAFVAYRLGDPTAYNLGRVSLNPVVHFDAVGAILMVLLVLGQAPIAWGRPVPISVQRIWGGRRGFGIASLAGPLSNLLLATLASIPWQFGFASSLDSVTYDLLKALMTMNLGLAAFNMLPMPPLDGFNTLAGFVPQGWATPLERLRRPASAVLLVLVLLPWLGAKLGLAVDLQVLQMMVGPVLVTFTKLLMPAGGCCQLAHFEPDHNVAAA